MDVSLFSIQRCGENLGLVRLGYSEIRISFGGVTKTKTPKTQTSDPENSDPSNLFKKDLHCKLVLILIYGHVICVHLQQPKRSEIFIFSGLSLSGRSNSEKLTRFKTAADILMAFAGEFL